MGWTFREAVGAVFLINEKVKAKQKLNVWDVFEAGRCVNMDEARKLMRALVDSQVISDAVHVEKGKVVRLDFTKKPGPKGGGVA